MEKMNAAGGYGPPGGGGYGPPGSGGGWGPPGGGYGAPPSPPGVPPGGGYGAPPGGGYGSPPAGGFGGTPGQGSPVGFVPAPMMPGAGGDVNTTTPLILNILALVMCGGTVIGLPTSIAGIVFAVQAKARKASGDIVSARAKTKLSFYCAAGTVLFGFALVVIWSLLLRTAPPPTP